MSSNVGVDSLGESVDLSDNDLETNFELSAEFGELFGDLASIELHKLWIEVIANLTCESLFVELAQLPCHFVSEYFYFFFRLPYYFRHIKAVVTFELLHVFLADDPVYFGFCEGFLAQLLRLAGLWLADIDDAG
jgi:hypothetical protein